MSDASLPIVRKLNRLLIVPVGLFALASANRAAAAADNTSQPRPPGNPTVVFEAGLGDGESVWRNVRKTIDPQLHTFAYDRPGYGKAAKNDGPRTPCATAQHLHALLRAQNIRPPYVLVGHSMGGLYQYVFARLYPQEVAGLVLVDATHPKHWETMQRDAPSVSSLLKVIQGVAFSSTMQREFREAETCTSTLPTTPFAFPVRVLAKTKAQEMETPGFREMLKRLNADWLRLTGAQSVQYVRNSGHYIQKEQPDAVVAAIREVVAERY